ncbi:MAG: hypothetical protein HYY18_17790, partial [Planctomycetes bacterium]|nr:hypothetical protein [Planctomycetota bacterium]
MTRTRLLHALALLALSASIPARAQETPGPRVVRESDGTNEIAPGDTWEGSAAAADEMKIVFLVCGGDVVCDVEVTVPERGRTYLMAGPYVCNSEVGLGLKLTRARFKKGRHELRIRPHEPGGFKLSVTLWKEEPGFDIEPNNGHETAQPLPPKTKMRGTISLPGGDHDCFAAEVEKGPIHVSFRRVRQGSKDRRLNGTLNILGRGAGGRPEIRNSYALNEISDEFHFFPVVEKGRFWIAVGMGSSFQGDEYDIAWEPLVAGVTDAEKEAARAALARGETWLREHGPGGKTYEPNPAAIDALALMALLAGDAGRRDRPWLEDTYLRRIEGHLKPVPGVKWRGEDLFGHAKIYEHAILTLALAEAVAEGFESAKPACLKAARYLLAAQLTGHRPAGWNGPVLVNDDFHGGWRYAPNSTDMDISATGWCLVALIAVDAAGLEVDGL